MKYRALAFAVVFATFATPALAGHCPADVRAINAALAMNPVLTAEQLAQVIDLRDRGEALHPGDHGASLALLHQAMEILGIAHG